MEINCSSYIVEEVVWIFFKSILSKCNIRKETDHFKYTAPWVLANAYKYQPPKFKNIPNIL